jgi:hypothetical protein
MTAAVRQALGRALVELLELGCDWSVDIHKLSSEGKQTLSFTAVSTVGILIVHGGTAFCRMGQFRVSLEGIEWLDT